MADYTSTGLWHNAGHVMEVSELNVSSDVLDDLQEWVNDYEDMDEDITEDALKEWSMRGFSIATEIKRQLRDCTVVYFDEYQLQKHSRLSNNLADRLNYEYEVPFPGELK